MREIEFRGQANNGRWIYGSLVYSESIQPAIYFEVGHGEVKTMDWAYVKPTSVGQFTGLYDKHKKKIYEGDICRLAIRSLGQEIVTIIWNNGLIWNNGFWINNPAEGLLSLRDFVESNNMEIEVIGNVHDNPELITQN